MVDPLEARALEEDVEKCGWKLVAGQSLNSTLRRGWYWGSTAFRQKLLRLINERLQQAKEQELPDQPSSPRSL